MTNMRSIASVAAKSLAVAIRVAALMFDQCLVFSSGGGRLLKEGNMINVCLRYLIERKKSRARSDLARLRTRTSGVESESFSFLRFV